MMGLSTSHLLILAFVALLFGARRLPEVGASMGSAIRAFKAAVDGRYAEIPQNSEKQGGVHPALQPALNSERLVEVKTENQSETKAT